MAGKLNVFAAVRISGNPLDLEYRERNEKRKKKVGKKDLVIVELVME